MRDVSCEIPAGRLVALRGRSGSGKTTLLNIISGLDKPTRGRARVLGHETTRMHDRELTELRRHFIGFIFQTFALLPVLSAFENVELPLRIAGVGARDRTRRTTELLELVGLGLADAPPPLRALRGRAGARRHRPSAGQRAGPDRRRRAHRRAGQRHRVADHDALPADRSGAGGDHHHGHPRPDHLRDRGRDPDHVRRADVPRHPGGAAGHRHPRRRQPAGDAARRDHQRRESRRAQHAHRPRRPRREPERRRPARPGGCGPSGRGRDPLRSSRRRTMRTATSSCRRCPPARCASRASGSAPATARTARTAAPAARD